MTEITITEINTRLSALVVAMLAKGVEQPRAQMTLECDARPNCILWSSSESKSLEGKYLKILWGADEAAALASADAYVAAMPDPATAKLTAHMRRVADCIDKGREDGIDDEYIAPLVVVKQAMTENLLTSQVSA